MLVHSTSSLADSEFVLGQSLPVAKLLEDLNTGNPGAVETDGFSGLSCTVLFLLYGKIWS